MGYTNRKFHSTRENPTMGLSLLTIIRSSRILIQPEKIIIISLEKDTLELKEFLLSTEMRSKANVLKTGLWQLPIEDISYTFYFSFSLLSLIFFLSSSLYKYTSHSSTLMRQQQLLLTIVSVNFYIISHLFKFRSVDVTTALCCN